MLKRSRWIALLACLSFTAACGSSHAFEGRSVWVELGTNSGPIPAPDRSEPAHVLLYHGQTILIDVGDGAAEQLAKANIPLTDVQTIFISHLHFDHTGGLFAFLGLVYQGGGLIAPPITIYGPPGTKKLVDNLRAAIQPGASLLPQPMPKYRVIELTDGARVSVGEINVITAANSHYALWGDKGGAKPVALSYRFNMPDRSIVYTGDTGPSANVEKLARGATLLVSEIMDADTALERLKQSRLFMPGFVVKFVQNHFTREHLSADQVGLLAQQAGVRQLVLTHFGGAFGGKPQIARLTKQIATHYKGPIHFASDLERF